MPEYMTKCEPVDKKPYIVYTDEKGILYSGDPDSDIPGGGGDSTVKCYMLNAGSPKTPLNVGDISVKDFDDVSVTVSEDTITAMGETVSCISFIATVGGAYIIENGDKLLVDGSISVAADFGKNLPSTFDESANTLTLIAFSEPMAAFLGVDDK